MSEYKILIPLDGSRYAEHALAFLPPMKHLGDVRLELLSVIDDTEYGHELVPSEEEERERNVLTTYLHEVASDIQKYLSIAVAPEVLRGNPADVIVEKARRLDADAILISSHGRSGIMRWRRGSVADKVLRTAHGPVFMVGPRAMERGEWLEAEAVQPFARILVPLDGSEAAEQALPAAVQYASAYHSVLHLFQAISLGNSYDVVPSYSQEILDSVIGSGEEYLAATAKQNDLPESVVTSVRLGTPTVLLEDYIAENDIDLVVMTSHGRGGLSRAALGSVTDRLIGVGPPVLVVRAQQP
jgi:nucleotide-binding universal stress UspA family protein